MAGLGGEEPEVSMRTRPPKPPKQERKDFPPGCQRIEIHRAIPPARDDPVHSVTATRDAEGAMFLIVVNGDRTPGSSTPIEAIDAIGPKKCWGWGLRILAP